MLQKVIIFILFLCASLAGLLFLVSIAKGTNGCFKKILCHKTFLLPLNDLLDSLESSQI